MGSSVLFELFKSRVAWILHRLDVFNFAISACELAINIIFNLDLLFVLNFVLEIGAHTIIDPDHAVRCAVS